jgi:hypothetical protein
VKGSLDVADIFRALGPAYRKVHGHEMPIRHLRAMRAIEAGTIMTMRFFFIMWTGSA